ncbi:MAG: DUF1365 domain-containing protein [Sulfuritalea sp.]|jgi:DUF1365 family protein|nr:DUF1365 domain-containing protein [Sulfuritalea sp.]
MVFNAQPCIGFGQVRHTRHQPKHHAFSYRTYFLMLPMRSLKNHSGALAVNRFSALSFFDKDHGDGRSPKEGGALAWLDEVLRAEGIDDATGEVWLHCYPRVLGFTFKPVSFWYCHRRDGSLRAVLVEVNNTFGERHCYVLDHARFGVEQRAEKVFHVSPFCPVEGEYRFRLMVSSERTRTVARIDYFDAAGLVIQTSVSGTLEPVTRQALRKAVWTYPLMTLAVVARIHWQALRLFFKRLSFYRQPPLPSQFISR